MKIVYDMSVDDHVSFSIFHHKHSRSSRRTLMIGGVVFPVCMFLLLSGLSIYKGQWGAVATYAVFFAVLMIWILSGNKKTLARVVRKMLKEGENKMDIGLQTLEVTSEGLADKNEFSESKFNWKAIERIASTPDYYYIYVSAMKALVVPKLKVTEGDFEEFRRLVEEGFRGAASIDGRTFDEKKIVADAKPIFKGDPSKKGHCCGVVSLAGGVVAGALYGLVAGLMFASAAGGQAEESAASAQDATVGQLILWGIVANLVGTGYGIAGLINRRQKKLLPILGLVVNSGILFVIVILVMIGMIIGG